MRLVHRAPGPFSLLKNEHCAQVLSQRSGLAVFLCFAQMDAIQYPGPVHTCLDGAAGPFSLLKNEDCARSLALQHSGPLYMRINVKDLLFALSLLINKDAAQVLAG